MHIGLLTSSYTWSTQVIVHINDDGQDHKVWSGIDQVNVDIKYGTRIEGLCLRHIFLSILKA